MKPTLYDNVGLWLSGLCLVHCIGSAALLLFLPALNALPISDVTHQILAVVLPLIAFAAFIPGYRQHGRRRVLVYGATGLCVIILAALNPGHQLSHLSEEILTIFGSLLLITAHWQNRKYGHRHRHGDIPPEEPASTDASASL